MIKKALFFSFSSNYLSFVIQFISVVFIARLITPEEMGVFSIAASFMVFAHALRSFGLGQYIIQENELTESRIRAAFSLSLFFGFVMFFFTYSISSYAGIFYEHKGIQKVLEVLSVIFLIAPFGAISLSYLQRDMNFKVKMIIDISASVVKASLSICLAYEGYSYMSLAYGSLAEAATIVILSVYFRPKQLPKTPGIKDIRHVFLSSWKLALVGFLSTFTGNITEVMLGKVVGIQTTGYFSRAKAGLNIFNLVITNAIKPVVLPYFSNEKRQKKDLGAIYLQATSLITIFAWPFFSFLGINSLEVLRVLYGSQWDASAPLLSILCIGAAIHFYTLFFEQLSIASGDSNSAIKMFLITLVSIIIIITTFATYGIIYIISALTLIPIIKLTYVNFILIKRYNLTVKALLQSSAKSLLVTILVLIAGFFSHLLLSIQEHEIISLLLNTLITLIFWLTGVLIFDHPIKSELKLGLNKLNVYFTK